VEPFGYNIDSFPGRAKPRARRIPPEHVVAEGCLAAAAFHNRNAGQKPPVEIILVRGRQKVPREGFRGAVKLIKKLD
jgi:hypothetical protein